MKKCHIIDYNGVWENSGIISVPENEAEIILHFEDVNNETRKKIKIWQSQKKKIIVMQHGRSATSDYDEPRAITPLADMLLLWGESDEKRMKKLKHQNVLQTGSFIFSQLKPRHETQEKTIVFCPSNFNIRLEEQKEIVEILNEFPYKTVTKMVTGASQALPGFCKNIVMSDREKPGHIASCVDVLRNADLVVGITEGTFELMAYVLGIPVIIVNSDAPKTSAAYHVGLNDLSFIIEHALLNSDELMPEREYIASVDGGIELDTKHIIHTYLETL